MIAFLNALTNYLITKKKTKPTKNSTLILVPEQKPIMLITPNIKIQTESKKYKNLSDNRKRSFLDSGFDLLFKKHSKHIKDGGNSSTGGGGNGNHHHHHHHSGGKTNITDHLLHRGNPFRGDTVLDNRVDNHHHHNSHHRHDNSSNNHNGNHDHDKKWKPFESIKIYTEKKKSHDSERKTHNGKFC